MPRVLLTDHPWPDTTLERDLLARAGLQLVCGPATAAEPQEITRLAAETDPVAILTCWAPVPAAAIVAPSDLRIVARLGVGLDNIDVAAATARGAWVSNVPDYCVEEVADHAVALMLGQFRGVVRLDREVRRDGWRNPIIRLRRISSLCVGLIGFGRIGQATAVRLRSFGCRLLAHSRSNRDAGGLAVPVPLSVIQAEADVIVLQAPLTAETAGMVDRAFLRGCARRPLLINVGRGGLVDNEALLEALDEGWIGGAALDVIAGEPNPPAAVLAREDIIVTPHVAYLSEESLLELRRRACEDVIRAVAGEAPANPCNVPSVNR